MGPYSIKKAVEKHRCLPDFLTQHSQLTLEARLGPAAYQCHPEYRETHGVCSRHTSDAQWLRRGPSIILLKVLTW